jgi:hypothetical protein
MTTEPNPGRGVFSSNPLSAKAARFTRLKLVTLVLLHVVAAIAYLPAQTVGPDIELRATTTTGAASEAAAAFDQGDTYVAWRDTRTEGSNGGDIYVQKLGPTGQRLWATNGLPICIVTNAQTLPSISPDGAGGAVVTWLDRRANPRTIYAQRISSAGTVQWAVNGIFVGLVYGEFPYSYVHPAADGGFLVTWWDAISSAISGKYPVLAQKLDGNGVRLWDPGDPDSQDSWGSGIEVMGGITRGRSASDGAGGFVAIGKIREDGGFRFQRVSADGAAAWANPVDFNLVVPDTVDFNFGSDGAGGVIVAYLDNRDIRAFRVASDGTFPWGAGSILLQTNVVLFQLPAIAPSGAGGAFIGWVASSPHDVRVQHLTPNGALLWAAGGAIVPDGSTFEREPALISDGAGGIFVSFATSTSLRGQRLDSGGTAQWKPGGVNGVSFGSGELPIIGVGTSGPTVVFKRSAGLFARSVAVPASVRIASIEPLPNNQFRLALSGGVAGRSYEILRSGSLVPLTNNAWTLVGTLQIGQTWTDGSAPLTSAFYVARDPAP